jgi:UDP-2,3-diacylglucosamine hydrolase
VGSFPQDSASKQVACTLPIGHDSPLITAPNRSQELILTQALFEHIAADDVRIAADTHFRDSAIPGEAERRLEFIHFLDGTPEGTFLVLLGDIFDFYFEYRSVVPRRFLDIYAAIARTTARGVDMRFLGGNHDYWVGDFFARELGERVHQKEICIESQGRKLVLAHGDLVMPRDYGYKVLKSVIRNPAVIAVSKWIHPDVMDAIAGGVAHGSRTLFNVAQEKRARAVLAHSWGHFYDRGNDAFVMGHVHFPMHETREGKEFLIVGDWIEHYTFARMTNGRLRLESFKS